MSFSSEVKRELLDISDLSDEGKKALLYGILQGSSEIIISSIGYKLVIKTTLLNVLKVCIPLLKTYYDINIGMSYKDEVNLNKRRYYYIEIIDQAEKIINDFHLMPFVEYHKSDPLIATDELKGCFLRGLFISKGSINDPRKNCYHFEISSSKSDLIAFAAKLFRRKELDVKITTRRNQDVMYLKRSEDISSALAYIGANSGVFYFEDQRIIRDVSNMANRMANCDIANEVRCAKACDEQLEAIRYIRENDHFDSLSARLQATCILREQYPDSSLEELSMYSSNVFGKTLSKSGISHCIKALMTYYMAITKENTTS